jgi:hypothetical protein
MVDVLPETVAVGNVSAKEQPGKSVVRLFSITVTRVTTASDSVAIAEAVVVY